MPDLAFFIKRLRRMDYGKFWDAVDVVTQRSGKPRAYILWDMLRCGLRYNAGYMDYKIARMYDLNAAQRRSTITRGINNRIVRDMNDKAYWHFFDDKSQFNTLFAQWVGRAWLLADKDLTVEALSAFLQGHTPVFIKPLEGSSGVGVRKATQAEWADIHTFHQELVAQAPSILEEAVVQHETMSALCPTSVNTVRFATLLGDKAQGIVYAFLRIGNGKVMDNVDCGGMAARVDLDTGILKTVAADKQGNVFEVHPITGTPIVGFQLPYFEEAKRMCLEAMQVVPQMRYVAWDVALTPQGPRFIEGNSFPSHAVPQFAAHYPDGIGILPEFRKYIDI